MENGRASGWHMSRGGATHGPYEWNDLVEWAQDGRLAADDLLWHPELPGWTQAAQVQGLFASPAGPGASWNAPGGGAPPAPPPPGPPQFGAPGGAPSPQPMWYGAPQYPFQQAPPARKGRWAIWTTVAVIVIAGAVVGALFGLGVFSDKAPLVRAPMQAETIIDVPYESAQFDVTPEGGKMVVGDVEMSVPSGAVDSDTPVEVKLLSAPFHALGGGAPGGGTMNAVALEQAVDFGPAGTRFNEPVTISIPYDDSLLPEDADEGSVTLAYWDGGSWVEMEGAVDTGNNTVSVKRNHFAGETWVPIWVPTEQLTGDGDLTLVAVVPLDLDRDTEAVTMSTGGAGTTGTTGSTSGTGTSAGPVSGGDISGRWTGSWTHTPTGQETPIVITFARDEAGDWTGEWLGDPAGPVPIDYSGDTIRAESRGMVFEGTLLDDNTIEGWGKTTSSVPQPDVTWRITR